ncbi:MAG: hypothetical protein LBB98_14200 [Treponema sp.]|jgi:hypothetical protein|nr:hypothetical protein [Treponema sp.]
MERDGGSWKGYGYSETHWERYSRLSGNVKAKYLEKIARRGKKNVWNDISKRRFKQDELETADEQTSKVDRKGDGAGDMGDNSRLESDTRVA